VGGSNRRTGVIVQERDRRLLAEIATMRIIDRELAKVVAGFGSTTRANARLLKLTRAGLLNRFFIGSVAAGRKAIYTLSPKGGIMCGAEYRRISRSHGATLVGDLYVDHQMRVNEVYVAVRHRPLPAGIRSGAWRTFQQPFSQDSRLIPDGYFELTTHSRVTPVFLEVDLGSESTRVWEQKARSYLQLAISGEFPRLFRQPQFRVAVVTTTPRRLAAIRAAIARQTDKVFWLADFQTTNRAGLWSAVWLRPRGDQLVPLT
jgi:Replication-relaxation